MAAALVVPLLAGCGSAGSPDGDAGSVTQRDLEALPGVQEAAAGEFEASDGEDRQTIAVVDLEPDATVDEMTTAVEAVEGSGADFWAVYLDGDGIDPEYPTDDGASGFSSGDMSGMPDPASAVPVVLGAREAARRSYSDARARATWEDGTLAVQVLLPGAGTQEVTAVAGSLLAEEELADGPVAVTASGHEPFDGRPVSQLVPAGSLTGADGIDETLLARWDRLVDAVDRRGDDAEPVSVSLAQDSGRTSVDVRLHLLESTRVYSASGELLRPGDHGYRRYYTTEGDPAEITTTSWGDRLWPLIDGVLALADDGSTRRWTVRVSEVRDPLETLLELDDDSPRPPADGLGRTWSQEAWQRTR